MTSTGKRTKEDARGERVKKARTREKEKQVRVSVVNVKKCSFKDVKVDLDRMIAILTLT